MHAHDVRGRVVATLMALSIAVSTASGPAVQAATPPSPPKAEVTEAKKAKNRTPAAVKKVAPEPEPSPVEIALATAHEQLGKPYRWAGAGPNAFDCSGLTSFVWRAAGVELPRTSRGQFGGLPRVPLDELEPGDLVYSTGHIALYIGDGKMIHSPQSGRRVEIAPLRTRLIGAVRPALLAS